MNLITDNVEVKVFTCGGQTIAKGTVSTSAIGTTDDQSPDIKQLMARDTAHVLHDVIYGDIGTELGGLVGKLADKLLDSKCGLEAALMLADIGKIADRLTTWNGDVELQ